MNPIRMVRNADREWPDNAPPGTYDIEGLPDHPRLMYVCPNGKRCTVLLQPNRVDGLHSWAWDGNVDAPTLSPSIDCRGCWHGFIVAGEMRTA